VSQHTVTWCQSGVLSVCCDNFSDTCTIHWHMPVKRHRHMPLASVHQMPYPVGACCNTALQYAPIRNMLLYYILL